MGEGLLLAKPVCGVGSEESGLCQVEPFTRELLFIFFLKKNQENSWRCLGVGAGWGEVS